MGRHIDHDTSGGGDLLFFTRADNSNADTTSLRMIVKDTGKVGIGTASPSSLLHLNSDNLTNIDVPLLLRNAGSGSTLANTFTAIKFQVGDANAGPSESGYIGAGQVGESGSWSNDSRMMFWVGNSAPNLSNAGAGAPAVTLKGFSSGAAAYVGMGTTDPIASLDIRGAAGLTSCNNIHITYIPTGADTDSWYFQSASNARMHIVNRSTSRGAYLQYNQDLSLIHI